MQVKEFLTAQGLDFEVKDVHTDTAAQQEMADMGMFAIPVTVIDDGDPILGADFPRIAAALAS